MIYSDKQLIAQHFSDHIATFNTFISPINQETIETLLWKKKDNTTFSHIWYHAHHGKLFVSGDLGEATYIWYENVSLKWISGLALSYFKSKCQASESGLGYLWHEWDENTAIEQIKQYFIDNYDPDDPINWEDFCYDNGEYYLSSQEEWNHWLEDNAEKFFGQDYWEFAHAFGQITPIRCRLHLLGLQCAFNTLEDQTKQT